MTQLLYAWEAGSPDAGASGVCEARAAAGAELRKWMLANGVTAGRLEEVTLSLPLLAGRVSSAYQRTGKSWRAAVGEDGRFRLRREGPHAGHLPGSALTAREREVAEMAAAGTKSADIAAALWLSLRTVDTHLSNVYAKTGTGVGTGARGRLASWLRRHPAVPGG